MNGETKEQLITRAFITPECRENRGDEGAWEEAVRRLRTEYDAVLAGWADAEEKPTFALMLFYERPIPDETAPVIPPLFAGSEPVASTQPPSPQAEVQDCDDICVCGHERYMHALNETEEGPCRERGCDCKGFPTDEQPPAEPQGDVVENGKAVELLAERLFRFHAINTGSDRRWDRAADATKNGWREDARSHLAKLVPLLALDVRERLESLIPHEIRCRCEQGSVFEWRRHRKDCPRREVIEMLGALAPAPSEPEEG